MSQRFAELAMTAFTRLPLETQQRAAHLIQCNRVETPEVLPTGYAFARVKASGSGFRVVQGSLFRSLSCSCSWRTECKHVAAVLITIADRYVREQQATQQGIGREPRGTRPLEARPLDPAERWLVSLEPPQVSAPADGEDGEIVFVLDISPSRTAGFARIWLGERRRHRNGAWRPAQRMKKARHQALRAAASPGTPDELWTIDWGGGGSLEVHGRPGAAHLRALLVTGRVLLRVEYPRKHDVSLRAGAPVEAKLTWVERVPGEYRPAVDLGHGARQLIETCSPPLYVDADAGLVGEVHAARDVSQWLAAPRISEKGLMAIAPGLEARGLPVPRIRPQRTITEAPTPRLTLVEERQEGSEEPGARHARLEFRYADQLLPPAVAVEKVTIRDSEDERVLVERDIDAEQAALMAMRDHSFYQLVGGRWLNSEVSWLDFLLDGARQLRDQGFEIEVDPSFSLCVVEPEDYYAELEESDNDWFELDYGIEVDGERISIFPLLIQALREPGAAGGSHPVVVQLPSGALAAIPRERIEPLVAVLIELATSEGGASRRLTRWQAVDLAEALRIQGNTARALRALRQDLTDHRGLQRPKLPRGFKATLREYQWDGVAWLGALGKHGVGCVLADDMGLGKTVQLLAHVASRKHRRLARGPTLVVMPTSVLLSWSEQIEAFTPRLRVEKWHGVERHERLDSIPSADIVLTSYALLARDIEMLVAQEWDLVVLDEAQAIKNPKAIAGAAARRLRAQQRIAVTGTPLENHLGEVWSIFSFAAPGVLGTEPVFKQVFRQPIEKGQDAQRMEALRRRVSPLLLRRTKEEVAADLPPKSIITQPVEFQNAQRDLYETVRKLMDRKVRDEIARRGFAQSRIVLLDALLKLRQVCCDPALLKTRTDAKKVPSAKRTAFLDLLEGLLSEGRRVLVFSQFVEMLDRLGKDLKRRHIAFARLTGDTRDRGGEVSRFKDRQVSVFLISLKAGGVGLNLTEADTVIHYDPWWNPATEAQATDRTHRIGQTKPVFVYRLIVSGSVEEKIVALQARKAALANALLSEGTQSLQLDEALLDELFAPMPASS